MGWLVKAPEAYQALLDSGDFIMVNIRTILYVVVCMPLFFVVGLTMAILLNNQFLRGVTFFPGRADRPLGRVDRGHHDVAGLAVLFPADRGRLTRFLGS